MSKKIEPDFSFTPDIDRVEAYKAKQKQQDSGVPHSAPVSSGGGTALLWVMLLLIVAGAGVGGWWLHQQNLILSAELASADQRIRSLESQLSATGEEMGESTVAMRAKINSLSTKTDELWDQMDKLWASAWRRNQADIKELKTQNQALDKQLGEQKEQLNKNAASMTDINRKQQEASLFIEATSEQLREIQSVKNQLSALKSSIDSLTNKNLTADKNQIQLAGSIAQIESTQNALLNRIRNIESQLNQPSVGQ